VKVDGGEEREEERRWKKLDYYCGIRKSRGKKKKNFCPAFVKLRCRTAVSPMSPTSYQRTIY
jgi:hypothetical protein